MVYGWCNTAIDSVPYSAEACFTVQRVSRAIQRTGKEEKQEESCCRGAIWAGGR